MEEEERRFTEPWGKPSQERLLEAYADKPVREFITLDVHGLGENGATIHCRHNFDLRNTNLPLRVYIAEETNKGEALYYLSQAIEVLKREWERLQQERR